MKSQVGWFNNQSDKVQFGVSTEKDVRKETYYADEPKLISSGSFLNIKQFLYFLF